MTTSNRVDIVSNRSQGNYSAREQLARIGWALLQPLFRWSPRPFFGWRRWLLRLCGARVGRYVNVYPSSRVTMPWNLSIGDWSSLGEEVLVYNLGPVSVGARATISLGAVLCAGSHDHRQRTMPLLRPPIEVGDDCWVCAGAFVGPGVRVGAGAVVGARAVVVRDVPAWAIVAGNPARPVGTRRLDG